jgi:predicted lipoprotein with Yx(FWY)xxD motif
MDRTSTREGTVARLPLDSSSGTTTTVDTRRPHESHISRPHQNRGTVKNRIVTIAIAGLSVAALIGGIAIATTGGSRSAQSAGAVSPQNTTALASPGASSPASVSTAATKATVRTAMARVGGVVEVVLVNDKGLPLYTYKPDTATQSLVTGELAALWPPLMGSAPTGSGTSGSLAVVRTGNGRQVTYNGHFLYTFVEDSAGQVTGQGVQNFFVATPGLAPLHATAVSSLPGATPTRSGSGYSY